MPTYRYTGVYPRWFDGLTADDGSTLRLAPGQTVDLADDIDDPWLVPVKAPRAPAVAEFASRGPRRVPARTRSTVTEGPSAQPIAGDALLDVAASAPAPADAATSSQE